MLFLSGFELYSRWVPLLGAAIDYAATLKAHEILRASRSKMERASEQH